MLKEINYTDYANKAVAILSKGAFLNTSANGKNNTMTIAWGSIGFMWGTPVFTIMVRKSRYTHEILAKNPEFTVSIPLKEMKEALKICGTKSGRNCDKFAEANLTANPGQKVNAPIIEGAGLHFECKVVYQQDMKKEDLDPAVADRWYKDNDYHTLYYGEIIAAYIEE